MTPNPYLPDELAARVLWLGNFADKLPLYGENTGMSAEEVAARVNDARFLGFMLGTWEPALRAWAKGLRPLVRLVMTGKGLTPVNLHWHEEPSLPPGVSAVRPGALRRITQCVSRLKLHANYTSAMGKDLGAVAGERTLPEQPKLQGRAEVGPNGGPRVRLRVCKYNHDGVWLESRRGGGGWESLGPGVRSPRFDDRPLLVPGQPEMREYRACFWDDGRKVGDWTPVVSVVVVP